MVYVPAGSPANVYEPSARVTVVRVIGFPLVSIPVSVTVTPAIPVSGCTLLGWRMPSPLRSRYTNPETLLGAGISPASTNGRNWPSASVNGAVDPVTGLASLSRLSSPAIGRVNPRLGGGVNVTV